MANIAEHIRQGKLPASIAMVISSTEKAGGIAKAQALGLPVRVIRRKDFADVEAYSQAMWEAIRPTRCDLVCMGGFLSLLRIPEDFEGRVMNVHPALLPKFGGKGMWGHHVHEAVLKAGEVASGCTVHFVDNQYDHGAIILQRSCPVLPGETPDSLAGRVMEQERMAYPEAIRRFAAGELRR